MEMGPSQGVFKTWSHRLLRAWDVLECFPKQQPRQELAFPFDGRTDGGMESVYSSGANGLWSGS
jgi:hypothetical protein